MDHISAREVFRKKLKTKYKMEEVAFCPLCSSKDAELISNQERHGLPFQVLACTRCCLLRTSPRLDSFSLQDHYNSDAQQLKRGKVQQSHRQLFELQKMKAKKIISFLEDASQTGKLKDLSKIQSVVEVGCGEGGGVSVFQKRFGHAIGFELYEAAVNYGRTRGLELYANSLGGGINNSKFNLIVYEQVFEHVSNLGDELKIISASQKVGDYLYIGVPGLLNIGNSYESNLIAYFEYQHLHHFTLNTLELLMAKHNYELVVGNQVVQALFEKVASGESIAPKMPMQTYADLSVFLLNQEKIHFQKRIDIFLHAKYFVKLVLFKLGLKFITKN